MKAKHLEVNGGIDANENKPILKEHLSQHGKLQGLMEMVLSKYAK